MNIIIYQKLFQNYSFLINYCNKYDYTIRVIYKDIDFGGRKCTMFFVDNNQKANFELDYAFPLVVHETFLRDKPMGFNNWHWHEEIQLSLVTKGAVRFFADGKQVLEPVERPSTYSIAYYH